MNSQTQGHSNIKWGAIIAGAAILGGAVLFAPSLMTSVGDIFGNIADGIANLFRGSAQPMAQTTKDLLLQLGGAVLVGGGLTYFLSGKDTPPAHHRMEDTESFRTKLEIDRTNNLMVMRAAYAGNPQAQAMLAQGMGR
jgi:hypothetical protein